MREEYDLSMDDYDLHIFPLACSGRVAFDEWPSQQYFKLNHQPRLFLRHLSEFTHTIMIGIAGASVNIFGWDAILNEAGASKAASGKVFAGSSASIDSAELRFDPNCQLIFTRQQGNGEPLIMTASELAPVIRRACESLPVLSSVSETAFVAAFSSIFAKAPSSTATPPEILLYHLSLQFGSRQLFSVAAKALNDVGERGRMRKYTDSFSSQLFV